MAQTRPSPTLSRGFSRLGRFLAPCAIRVANPPCWASKTAANLNLTMPARTPRITSPFAAAHSPCLSRPPERMWTDTAYPRPATTRRNRVHDPARDRLDHHLR